MEDEKGRGVGYLYIVAAAACWATLGPVARLAFGEGVAPLEVAFWRATLGGACFVLHVLARRRRGVAARDVPAVLGFGVLGVTVFYASYLWAVEAGGAALASVLLYTAPAWVAVMSALWLGERMTGAKVVAVVVTVGGVACIALGGGGALRVTAAAIGWGLVAGWSYALYYPFGKLYFARYPAALVLAYALPAGALGLLPFVSQSPKTPVAWAAIGWLGIVSTYVAYTLYARGLQRLEATRASVVATLEPVMAAMLAYLWWGERFDASGYAGAALVLVGVVLAVTARERTPQVDQTGTAG